MSFAAHGDSMDGGVTAMSGTAAARATRTLRGSAVRERTGGYAQLKVSQ